MRIFDTHCYTGLISPSHQERVLSLTYAKLSGVEKVLNISNSLGDFEEVYNDLKLQKNLYFALGISPVEVNNPSLGWREKLQSYSKFENVIAIGETGLDYQKGCADMDLQKEFFIHHIKLAESVQKPLIIHNRQASRDIIKLLVDNNVKVNVIFHCYSDTPQNLEKALELPSYFSFSGNVTYPKAKEVISCAKAIPIERILIESGTPFMSPISQKNSRNKIQNISENLRAIAQIKDMDVEKCANVLWDNSLRVFGL